MITEQTFSFLKDLQANNNRDWFAAYKDRYIRADEESRAFFNTIYEELQKTDSLEKLQIFRIYRDVRFSKDKSPYKKFLSAWFSRAKPFHRGSYYIHIEPGNSFIEGGFWEPNANDLMRIRRELELHASPMRAIIAEDEFTKYFGELSGNALKTSPKGFDKEHPAIDLIRKKQFLIVRRFADSEVLDKDFHLEVSKTYTAMRPFLDYMSEILTTNLDGESIIDI